MNPQAALFGKSRLREIIERHTVLAPEELLKRRIDEIYAFPKSEHQHDDITMLLVRVSLDDRPSIDCRYLAFYWCQEWRT